MWVDDTEASEGQIEQVVGKAISSMYHPSTFLSFDLIVACSEDRLGAKVGMDLTLIVLQWDDVGELTMC